MADLRYQPNSLARGLSESRSGTIGVVINDLRNPWYVNLLEGLAATLDADAMLAHLDATVADVTDPA